MVADFLKKQKREGDNLWLKTLAIFVLVGTIFLITKNIGLYQKKKELALQIQNYTEQIERLQESNKKIKDGIANIDNQEYIEKVAREEENMQKSGEKVVSFIMPTDQAKQEEKNTWNSNFLTAGLSKFWQGVKNIFK